MAAVDRVAQASKGVAITGCAITLLFWVIIPVVLVLIALAATSVEGAVAVGVLVLFIVWLFRKFYKASGRP